MIQRVTVISLPSRPERLAAFLRRWQDTALSHLVPTVQPGVRHREPSRGCVAAHIAAMRAAAAVDSTPLLVCEDDAIFTDGFPCPASPPLNWEVLWLGAEHLAPPRPIIAGWMRPVEIMRTHCYIVRDPGRVAALLKGAPRIDPYLSRLPMPQYVVEPQTVGQAAGISDTGEKPCAHDRYWHLRRRRS